MYIRALSSDGVTALNPIELFREAIALGLRGVVREPVQ